MRSDLLLCEKMTALSPNKDAGGERDPQASGPHVIAPERSAGAEAGDRRPRVAMVGGDDRNRLDAIRARRLGLRHRLVIVVDAVGIEPERGA